MSGVPLPRGNAFKHQLSTSDEITPDLVWAGGKSCDQSWWACTRRPAHSQARPPEPPTPGADSGQPKAGAGGGQQVRGWTSDPIGCGQCPPTDLWHPRGGRRIRGLCLSPTWQNVPCFQNLLSPEPGKDPHGPQQREPASVLVPTWVCGSPATGVCPPCCKRPGAGRGEVALPPPPTGSAGPLTWPPQCSSGAGAGCAWPANSVSRGRPFLPSQRFYDSED